MPDMVRNDFFDETSEATPDGRLWPRPMQLLMEEGDACFTVFHTPHSGSRNQNGSESRKNIIFRIRADAHQPSGVHALSGFNDHPDRGQAGEWLDYPEGVDPYARSKHLLCHPWGVWDGMRCVGKTAFPSLFTASFPSFSTAFPSQWWVSLPRSVSDGGPLPLGRSSPKSRPRATLGASSDPMA